VLRALVANGKIGLAQVRQTLNNRQKEIQELKRRLKALEGLEGNPRGSGRARTGPKRRRRLSSRVRALRRLQGRYMGFVRRLTDAQKARVKAIREKQGLPAAIRIASSLARKA
jgi:hypothetical protein